MYLQFSLAHVLFQFQHIYPRLERLILDCIASFIKADFGCIASSVKANFGFC